jgi:hypothetical protein
VLAFGKSSQGLQPDLAIVSVKYIPLLELRSLLQSPAMRSNAGIAKRQAHVDLHFAHISVPPQLALWLGLATDSLI